jgi:hypothetical protein
VSTLLHSLDSPGPVLADSCLVVPWCMRAVQYTFLAAAQGVKAVAVLLSSPVLRFV